MTIQRRPITIQNVFINEELSSMPKTNGIGGYVYIFSTNDKMKIGQSKNWQQREKTISNNVGIPFFPTKIVTIRHVNYQQNEKIMLEYFKDYKIHSEWFDASQTEIAIDVLKTLNFKQHVKIKDKSKEKQENELNEKQAFCRFMTNSILDSQKSTISSQKEFLNQNDFWEYQKILIRDVNFRKQLKFLIKQWKSCWSSDKKNNANLLYFNTIEMTLYLTETISRYKQSDNLSGLCDYLNEGEVPSSLVSQIVTLFNKIPSPIKSQYIQSIEDLEEAYNTFVELQTKKS